MKFISTMYEYINERYTNDTIKIGDIYDEHEVYSYTQRIHHTSDDFYSGDLGERIERYKKYRVEEVNISDIDIDEFTIYDEYVDEYVDMVVKHKSYPPVVLNSDYSIIDGTHRLNALEVLGYKKVIAFVGIKKKKKQI